MRWFLVSRKEENCFIPQFVQRGELKRHDFARTFRNINHYCHPIFGIKIQIPNNIFLLSGLAYNCTELQYHWWNLSHLMAKKIVFVKLWNDHEKYCEQYYIFFFKPTNLWFSPHFTITLKIWTSWVTQQKSKLALFLVLYSKLTFKTYSRSKNAHFTLLPTSRILTYISKLLLNRIFYTNDVK